MPNNEEDFYHGVGAKMVLIPKITDEEIEEMLQVMKPVEETESGRYQLLDVTAVDRRKTAYTWDPKFGEAVRIYDAPLRRLRFVTFHTYGYQGFFKPSLAEVLGRMRSVFPDDAWKAIRYFSLKPAIDFEHPVIGQMIQSGFHMALCTVWGSEHLTMQDEGWGDFVKRCAHRIEAQNQKLLEAGK